VPEADLVVRGGLVVTPDGVIEADVAVSNGRISAIGTSAVTGPGTRVIDATRGAVVPGLVNAHMHECLERGVFEDLPFSRWLHEFAFPKDRAYEPRHQRAAALLSQLEMIRSGTTTFIDIFRYPAEAAEVALHSGLRAIFSPQVIDTPDGVGESLDSSVQFIADWGERLPDRIRTWFGPHSLYSCDRRTYEVMAAAASHGRIGIHTHLAESAWEVTEISERFGLTPAAYLDRLLGHVPHVVVAHAVWMTDADLELVAERGWGVAHCPTSNMKLGNGAARVPAMLDAGITVGLGTDSVMTNNNLDMWEEMRQASLLQKLVGADAAALPASDVLAMATLGSAAALGWDADIGSIEVGKWADLVVVDLGRPHLWPVYPSTLVAQLVYSASGGDVRTTIVGGEVLMEDFVVRTIDVDMVEELVHREARDLLEKAGVFGG
jgi:5-methylthioadenosine/S-adenosylhomocysteine deaminase